MDSRPPGRGGDAHESNRGKAKPSRRQQQGRSSDRRNRAHNNNNYFSQPAQADNYRLSANSPPHYSLDRRADPYRPSDNPPFDRNNDHYSPNGGRHNDRSGRRSPHYGYYNSRDTGRPRDSSAQRVDDGRSGLPPRGPTGYIPPHARPDTRIRPRGEGTDSRPGSSGSAGASRPGSGGSAFGSRPGSSGSTFESRGRLRDTVSGRPTNIYLPPALRGEEPGRRRRSPSPHQSRDSRRRSRSPVFYRDVNWPDRSYRRRSPPLRRGRSPSPLPYQRGDSQNGSPLAYRGESPPRAGALSPLPYPYNTPENGYGYDRRGKRPGSKDRGQRDDRSNKRLRMSSPSTSNNLQSVDGRPTNKTSQDNAQKSSNLQGLDLVADPAAIHNESIDFSEDVVEEKKPTVEEMIAMKRKRRAELRLKLGNEGASSVASPESRSMSRMMTSVPPASNLGAVTASLPSNGSSLAVNQPLSSEAPPTLPPTRSASAAVVESALGSEAPSTLPPTSTASPVAIAESEINSPIVNVAPNTDTPASLPHINTAFPVALAPSNVNSPIVDALPNADSPAVIAPSNANSPAVDSAINVAPAANLTNQAASPSVLPASNSTSPTTFTSPAPTAEVSDSHEQANKLTSPSEQQNGIGNAAVETFGATHTTKMPEAAEQALPSVEPSDRVRVAAVPEKYESVNDEDDMFGDAFVPRGEVAEFVNERGLDALGDKDNYYKITYNEVIHDRYVTTQVLGIGSYGQVIRAKDKKNDDRLVAVKIFRDNDFIRTQAFKEIRNLKRMGEEWDRDGTRSHIIQYIGEFVIKRKYQALVTEAMESDLVFYIRKNGTHAGNKNVLTLPVIRRFAQTIFSSLVFLQEKGLVHADIKPANILYDSERNEVKLCDLGALHQVGMWHNSDYRQVGTPFYMAPEFHLQRIHFSSADTWSVGCVLYELFMGRTFFDQPVTRESSWEILMQIQERRGAIGRSLMNDVDIAGVKAAYFDHDGNNYRLLDLFEKNSRRVQVVKSNAQYYIRNTIKAELKKLKKFDAYPPTPDTEVDAFINLIERCMKMDPKGRIDPGEALKHDFFKGKIQQRV